MNELEKVALLAMLFEILYIASTETTVQKEVIMSAAEIIKLRGYKAINHSVNTSDGYLLNLVQGLNPLIKSGERGLENKAPILFVHGLATNGNVFVANSVGARPVSYGNLNASELSLRELKELLVDDPASSSLAFTAMNFGHEVWILNRRGTLQSSSENNRKVQPLSKESQDLLMAFSRATINKLLSGSEKLSELGESELRKISRKLWNQVLLNDDQKRSRFWNFTLDDQALIDLPETIDYILNQTGKSKLAYVGHSMGGQLALMTLTGKPEYADKVSKLILWAPAFHPTGISSVLHSSNLEFIQALSHNGPAIPSAIIPPIKLMMAEMCSTRLTQYLICDKMYDVRYGYSGHQMSLLGAMGLLIENESERSLRQELQAIRRGTTHFFDYGTNEQNLIAYGQSDAPIYNLTRIKFHSISLWAGNTDTQVPAEAVYQIKEELSVPAEFHLVNESGIYFDHDAFLLHDNLSTLVIIPSLKTIEEP